MNQCTFLGTVEKLDVRLEDGVERAVITLDVENRRKKAGRKDLIERELLEFEAWDSAAKTLSEHCERDDILLIEATARQNQPFRINKFRILAYVEDVTPDD